MVLATVSGFRSKQAIFPGHNYPWTEGFILLAICLDPKSRGSVQIKPQGTTGQSDQQREEEDEEDIPISIDPRYLEEPEDMDCMKRGTYERN